MEKYFGVLERLKFSRFRSSFHLSEKDKNFVREKGLEKVERDAFEILQKRIGELKANDGRQTPWRGHPVFTAQHALALCCRKCMAKWYGISPKEKLNDEKIGELRVIVINWIERETAKNI